jgi:predicted HTH transcriptional regulator
VSETPVPSLLATLFERLQGQEALDLELKLARNSVPQSLWPTVSAFANTLGGWVLLGIGEEEGKFVVEGVSNPQALLQNIANTLRNGQKISYPACGANDLKIESVDGKDVVVLRVPPRCATATRTSASSKQSAATDGTARRATGGSPSPGS